MLYLLNILSMMCIHVIALLRHWAGMHSTFGGNVCPYTCHWAGMHSTFSRNVCSYTCHWAGVHSTFGGHVCSYTCIYYFLMLAPSPELSLDFTGACGIWQHCVTVKWMNDIYGGLRSSLAAKWMTKNYLFITSSLAWGYPISDNTVFHGCPGVKQNTSKS